MRRPWFVLALLAALACKPEAAAGPVDLVSGTVSDDIGEVKVDIKYRPGAGRAFDLVIELNALGLEEMDKLVVDVTVDGIVVVGGETQWSGFVPPRQPQKHEVGLQLGDDMDEGTVEVNVTRSRDSKLLLQKEVVVTFAGGKLSASGE